MDMTDKGLQKFALAECRKRRPRMKSFEISNTRQEMFVHWQDEMGRSGEEVAGLPEDVSLSGGQLTSFAKAAVHKLWPRLADWALLGTLRMRIAYTFGIAEIGTIVIDLPGDEPETSPADTDA